MELGRSGAYFPHSYGWAASTTNASSTTAMTPAEILAWLRLDAQPYESEAADLIESLQAAAVMKDARIDWTVADNVKKAIELEDLQAELKSLQAENQRLRKIVDDLIGNRAIEIMEQLAAIIARAKQERE